MKSQHSVCTLFFALPLVKVVQNNKHLQKKDSKAFIRHCKNFSFLLLLIVENCIMWLIMQKNASGEFVMKYQDGATPL